MGTMHALDLLDAETVLSYTKVPEERILPHTRKEALRVRRRAQPRSTVGNRV